MAREKKGIIYDVEQTINETVEKTKGWANMYKLRLLTALGMGSEYYTCQYCNKVLQKSDFYMCTDALNSSGISHICKSCATKIAVPEVYNAKKKAYVKTPCTKESVMKACMYMNKPFLDSVWDFSVSEAANGLAGHVRANTYSAYIKNISMKNYYGLTFSDSDNYQPAFNIGLMTEAETTKDQEVLDQFEKNKDDALRLIGYLPFDKEPPQNQPLLYAQLIGFLDSSENGNDDMMRVLSITEIVRGFFQMQLYDDLISQYTQDAKNAGNNASIIKQLQETKQKISSTITNLAEQSCISLKHTKNTSKGENTWTGKLKKIHDMNLRDYKLNGYSLETCKGMRQVADISAKGILNALKIDDSEWSDMVAQQRKKITELLDECDGYKEASRLLLKENVDLRDALKEHDALKEDELINLDNIVNTYFMGIGDDDG